MARRVTIAGFVSLLVLGSSTAAQAQDEAAPAPEIAPASDEIVAAPAALRGETTAAMYGTALRIRWITLPKWFLGMFTAANQPLSTYGYGGEFFRRKRDKDDPMRTWELSVGVGYQKMSPPDGNWLGKGGYDPNVDTDFVQFRNFGLVDIDFAFVARQYFNDYVGIHYGAGLGLGIVTGKILRTSSSRCNAGNLGDTSIGGCRPRLPTCQNSICTEAQLQESSTGIDNGPDDPHRFAEPNVPGAIPILNLVFGLDFRIPGAEGLELRLEGGFFDAFFAGFTAGYVF